MAFHDVRFPARLSFGSTGGPERLTEIVRLANGHEERNTPWAHSRRRYDAGLGAHSLDDIAEIVSFFEARRARLHAFRWKDWTDFQSCRPSQTVTSRDQRIGTGDGQTTEFPLVKAYPSGDAWYERPITKPVAGSVMIAIDGVDALEGVRVDPLTGTVTFTAPPRDGASVTAGFAFDVPVRFDTDALSISAAGMAAGDVPSIPVVEVRA